MNKTNMIAGLLTVMLALVITNNAYALNDNGVDEAWTFVTSQYKIYISPDVAGHGLGPTFINQSDGVFGLYQYGPFLEGKAYDLFVTDGGVTASRSVAYTDHRIGNDRYVIPKDDVWLSTIDPGSNSDVVVESTPDVKDENAAPSMGGFNTRDVSRVTLPTVKDPIFVMSNTEIHFKHGKVTDRFIPVYFDGVLIEMLDVGAYAQDVGQPWLDIGGKVVDIPFEAYYDVTPEGKLIHKGAGYQHVFRDFAGGEEQ